jgi:hypothetical protein
MRLRPNGTLDYRPMPMPEPAKHWHDMTYEEQRQHFIDWILYYWVTCRQCIHPSR